MVRLWVLAFERFRKDDSFAEATGEGHLVRAREVLSLYNDDAVRTHSISDDCCTALIELEQVAHLDHCTESFGASAQSTRLPSATVQRMR